MGERIALISDIHGNTPALRAVLDDIRREGCERLCMIGDIVNGLDPAGCIDLLHSWPGVAALKGNAEFYLLAPGLESFPKRGEPFYAELIGLIGWWRERLSPPQLDWLQLLPDLIRWDDMCLVHDSPFDRLFPEQRRLPGVEDQYQELCYHARGITPEMPAEAWERLLAWMEAEALGELFCGHTHVPFCRVEGPQRICNTGSVGMPLDGDPRASWVLVEQRAGRTREVTIRRVAYAVEDILALVDRTPEYPSFARPGVQAAYKRMLVEGRHWRHYV